MDFWQRCALLGGVGYCLVAEPNLGHASLWHNPMLPRALRLTKGFSLVFQKGVRISTPFFRVQAIPELHGASRLAVSVAKKTEKSAVRRNYLRRRLQEAVAVAGFPHGFHSPWRIVLVGYASAKSPDFSQLVETLQKTFAALQEKTSRPLR